MNANGFELQQDLNGKLSELSNAVNELRMDGSRLAEAKRAYEVLLAKEMLRLRVDEGLPASMVGSVAKGSAEVADAGYRLEAAETLYTAQREAINTLKREVDVIREQISREWSQAGSAL